VHEPVGGFEGFSIDALETDIDGQVIFILFQALFQQIYNRGFALLARAVDGEIIAPGNHCHGFIQFIHDIGHIMSFRDTGAGDVKCFCHF